MLRFGRKDRGNKGHIGGQFCPSTVWSQCSNDHWFLTKTTLTALFISSSASPSLSVFPHSRIGTV